MEKEATIDEEVDKTLVTNVLEVISICSTDVEEGEQYDYFGEKVL